MVGRHIPGVCKVLDHGPRAASLSADGPGPMAQDLILTVIPVIPVIPGFWPFYPLFPLFLLFRASGLPGALLFPLFLGYSWASGIPVIPVIPGYSRVRAPGSPENERTTGTRGHRPREVSVHQRVGGCTQGG